MLLSFSEGGGPLSLCYSVLVREEARYSVSSLPLSLPFLFSLLLSSLSPSPSSFFPLLSHITQQPDKGLVYLPSFRPMTTFEVIRQPLGVSKTQSSLSSEVITTEWRVLGVCIPYQLLLCSHSAKNVTPVQVRHYRRTGFNLIIAFVSFLATLQI